MNKSLVTSDEPVDVKLLNGTLTADKLRIVNGGEVVRFDGNVVMHLVMDQPDAANNPLDAPKEAPKEASKDAPKTRPTSPKPAGAK
jgi:lipopolysaccharide export system protein LptC